MCGVWCRWQDHSCNPDWTRHIIVDFLSSTALLDDLALDGIDVNLQCSMGRFPALQRLRITTANQRSPTSAVSPIAQVVSHSTNLTSLTLSGADDRSILSQLWATLAREQIHLTHITAGAGDPLLAYLCSYVGLRSLTLLNPDAASSDAKAARLADIFYSRALPHHAHSLVGLTCRAGYRGRWNFGTHNAAAIARLRALERLHMSVDPDGILGCVRARPGVSHPDANTAVLFLEVAAQLPVLVEVSISPPGSDSEEYAGALNEVVARFKLHSHSPAVARRIEHAGGSGFVFFRSFTLEHRFGVREFHVTNKS
ncbi:hypothetical protein B0H10DRAFT_1332944 [Mycena sp. CBHHK59/15]|nr:hypothetical protein B0H10DRAFT_1332944 [Mycena sp. CBHHK59/15]